MKKKDFLWSLLAIVMAATLSVGLSSCSKDDDPELSISSPTSLSINLQANGDGDKTITVSASHTDWSADVSYVNGSGWLTLGSPNGSSISFTVTENTTTSPRTAKVKIIAKADASLTKEVTVTQAGADGVISLSMSSIEFESEGGSQTITVTSNSGWNASSNQGWLTVSPSSGNAPTSGSGTTSVTLSASNNSTNSDRTCAVTFTTTDGKASAQVSITQKKPTPFILVNGTETGSHEFPGGFDNGKSGIDYKVVFKIKSNVQWTLSGKVDWLNISPISGNGDVDLTIYPTSENTSDKDRRADLTLSGTGISIPITIIQGSKWSDCYVIPANEVALYDRFCWEYTASANANNFQYLLLSEREYSRLTDNELREEVMQEEVLKYDDGWLSMTGYDSHDNRITSNSTYYFVSLATDKDGNYGALKKIKLKTPAYLDADQDAYVTFWNFDNTSYSFQFDAQKEGYCNTYHIIYGVYDEYLNTAVFAFEINYYLKNKQKHWLAKNEYYEWEIITDYPNNHTFSYSNNYMWYFTVCFGYGWGVFKDGSLSSDLIGFQVDTDSDSAPQMKARRMTDDSPKNVIIKKSEVLKRAKSMRRK